MTIDAAGAWILIAACCAGAVAVAVRLELRRAFYRRHARWREAPRRFAAVCAGAALDGVAIGMAIALVALTLGAIAVRAGV